MAGREGARVLFGGEVGSVGEDGFEGSKEEKQVFADVFYGNGMDEGNMIGVSGNMRASVSLNSKASALMSYLPMKDLSREAFQSEMIGSKETGIFQGFEKNASSRAGPDSRGANIKWRNWSFTGHLNHKKEARFSSLDVGDSSGHQVPCRIVESFGQGILSRCYLFDSEGEKNDSGNIGDNVLQHSKCRDEHIEDGKMVVEVKSITSTDSQESLSAEPVVRGGSADPEETLGTLVCTDQTSQEVDLASRRALIRELPARLHAQAHCLLLDAGWKIEPHKRSDRTKMAFIFIEPDGGLSFRALSQAWRACGESLLSNAPRSEQDDNAREWADIDVFWDDFTNTLSYIEEARDAESSLSLLHRWKILDPFMAVVWIDKRISALRRGKALRTGRTTTFLLHDRKTDKGVDQVDCHLPAMEPDCKSEVFEDACDQKVLTIQGVQELPKGRRCGQADKKPCPCGAIHKRSLKSLARRIGKGLYNPGCLHSMNHRVSAHHRKRTNRLSSKSNFVQRGSSSLCMVPYPSDFSNHQEFSTAIQELEQVSTENLVTSLSKKGRKRSKRISEIEATDVTVKGRKTKLRNGTSRDLFGFSMSDGLRDQFNKDNLLMWKSTPAHNVVKALKTVEAEITVAAEASSTTKKPVKTSTRAARQIGTDKKSNLHMSVEDEPRGTLMNGEGSQEDLAHYNSTTKIISSQQKKRPRPKKVPRHRIESKELVPVLDDANTHMESHSEGSNEILVPAIGSSVHPKNGRKRSRGCRINDDDLLIAAILKNKKFSFKRFASRVGASQSKAFRKLKSKKGGRMLLLRAPGKGVKDSMDRRRFILEKRTVLCWLIEMGIVSLKDIVQFRDLKNNEVVKDGWITRDGILCKCCSNILSVSDFKAHAGWMLHKPSVNLFLQSGKSYTLCQVQAWSVEYKARKGHMQVVETEESDQNDDTCGLCGDGGELICCDNCPSTYHQACLASQELPEGSWYCSNCICKTCRDVASQREDSDSLAVLECSQCEHKYHDTCIKEKATWTGEVGSGTWFCSKSCKDVYLGLRSRVGQLNNIGDGFSWTILRCSHDDQKIHSAHKIAAIAECNTKLAIALTIMEECFLPMVDPRTGIDMIPHVLYNWRSNFVRLNYQSFYTVVLEKGDELLSVASIRLHGVAIAEMPLIATCSGHRRQGMCRRLMNGIEKMLKSFKVKMLVISAIPDLVDTWTSGFGFKPVEDDDKQQLKNVNLMLFPGTSLLKKNLCEVIAQEPGPTLTSYSGNKGQNSDFCSREDQSITPDINETYQFFSKDLPRDHDLHLTSATRTLAEENLSLSVLTEETDVVGLVNKERRENAMGGGFEEEVFVDSKLNLNKALGDSSPTISKDDICDSVLRHPVTMSGNVEA